MVTMYDADSRVAEQTANQWLADAGLLKDDGSANRLLIVEQVVSLLVNDAFVQNVGDKLALAIRKGILTAKIVPTADAASRDPNPDNPTRLAFNAVQSLIWEAASEKSDSASQRLVGERTNGAVLIRCKMSAQMGNTWAAYVTDVPELIFLDYLAPQDERFRATAERYARAAALVATRQPSLARKTEKAIETATKAASTRARDQYRLLAASNENGTTPVTDDEAAA
jgi:hypothetical protein